MNFVKNMSLISIFLVFCDNLCILSEKFNLYLLNIISLTLRFFLSSYFVLFALCLNNFIFSSLASLCCACAVDLFVCFLRFRFCLVNWSRGYRHPRVLCVPAVSSFTTPPAFSLTPIPMLLWGCSFFLLLSGQEGGSILLPFICIYIFYYTCFWFL